jgi:hypothetical protein
VDGDDGSNADVERLRVSRAGEHEVIPAIVNQGLFVWPRRIVPRGRVERANEHPGCCGSERLISNRPQLEVVPDAKSDPQEYVDRGQCYFAFECEDPFLGTYVERLGSDSVVFSSDYPHWDSDFPGTVAEVRTENADLGEEVLAKALGGNARRLYGLDGARLSGVTA